MPTISFTVSTANIALLRAALAYHQGRDAADVTNSDVKEHAGRPLRAMVQKYREAQRDAATPVSIDDPLS